MEHKYSTKIKKHNIPYAKVGLRVFRSLFAAETYCTEKNLDVDKAIEYGESEELKVKIQEIAMIQKAVLRGVRDALDVGRKKHDQALKNAVQDLEQAEATRDLLINYYKDRVTEEIGIGSGLYQAREIVQAILEELEWMTGWKG